MTPKAITTIGNRLRTARLQRGYTQEELASRAGITVGSVSKIERDRSIPTFQTVQRLAIALEVSTWWLLLGEDNK